MQKNHISVIQKVIPIKSSNMLLCIRRDDVVFDRKKRVILKGASGITEFRRKNNAYSEHTKLSAIKHPCRVTQPTRKRARPAFLCPPADPCTDFHESGG
ncbi:hypothetical protein KM043_015894 [Ampulex compressa]|nr:hypothetical protein KM043_015894 [Ampulex compressa]